MEHNSSASGISVSRAIVLTLAQIKLFSIPIIDCILIISVDSLYVVLFIIYVVLFIIMRVSMYYFC